MTSGGESERLLKAYSIPSSARSLFQNAFGNLIAVHPGAECAGSVATNGRHAIHSRWGGGTRLH